MKKLTMAVCALLALALCGGAVAQEPSGPPKPGPEQQELGYWVGTWSGKGEMKPGPFGPGGPATWTEKCEWFEGKFTVVCHSDGKGPMGSMKGLGILGWNPGEKAYTYYGVDNAGYNSLSKGTVQGDKWIYTSTENMEGKTFHSRFTIQRVSPTMQKFMWEISEDGSKWMTMMEGESSKK